MDIKYLAILIVLISFIGWLLENLWLAITKGYIDNRNMNLPFLLGYGLLVAGFALFFGVPDNICFGNVNLAINTKLSWIMYFFIAFIIICSGEHLLGTAVEKICKIEYWNYEWIPCRFSKYTTIPTSTGFALLLTLFMGYVIEPLYNILKRIDGNNASMIGTICLVILTIDFILCFNKMRKNRTLNEKWRIIIKKQTANIASKSEDKNVSYFSG